MIHEGPKQKISEVEFVGNQVASSARLQTLIKSKRPWFSIPPIFGGYKGFVEEEKIEEDLVTLYSYYRSLGFFKAEIGREIQFNDEQKWATLRFVISEGPRYKVQNVTFIGNEKFDTEHLGSLVKLKAGEYFNQNQMDKDLDSLVLEYGSIGHVFADIQADPRFQDEPGNLDLVYSISEGARARVGRINVYVEGEHPHTKRTAILNQVSLQPGDILDIRKLRDSERRLRASGLFATNPMQGQPPRIVYTPPQDDAEGLAERPRRNYRGQSPDPTPHHAGRPAVANSNEILLDVNILEQANETGVAITPLPFPAIPSATDRAVFNDSAWRPSVGRTPLVPATERPFSAPRRSPFPPHLVPPVSRPVVPSDNAGELIIRGQSPGYHRWGEAPSAPSSSISTRENRTTAYREPVVSGPPYWSSRRPAEEPSVVRGQYSPFGGDNLPPLTPQRPPSYQAPNSQPQAGYAGAAATQQPGNGTSVYQQPAYGTPTAQQQPYQQPTMVAYLNSPPGGTKRRRRISRGSSTAHSPRPRTISHRHHPTDRPTISTSTSPALKPCRALLHRAWHQELQRKGAGTTRRENYSPRGDIRSSIRMDLPRSKRIWVSMSKKRKPAG